MDMMAVSSDMIESVGYDNSTRQLAVKFKSKPGKPSSVHIYHGTTLELYRQFLAAPSKGKFFHAKVKSVFPSRELAA
jgi:hypothetical protein